MSKTEAEDLIKKFLEYKMMWHTEDGFHNKYLVYQAKNILGEERVLEITKEIHKLWNEE